MKPAGRKFSEAENAIIRAGALAGHTTRQICASLSDAGYYRAQSSIKSNVVCLEARAERKRHQSGHVFFEELILRRFTVLVPAQTRANGEFVDVPITLSGGVAWQAPA